jgi:hypothetical protein
LISWAITGLPFSPSVASFPIETSVYPFSGALAVMFFYSLSSMFFCVLLYFPFPSHFFLWMPEENLIWQ